MRSVTSSLLTALAVAAVVSTPTALNGVSDSAAPRRGGVRPRWATRRSSSGPMR